MSSYQAIREVSRLLQDELSQAFSADPQLDLLFGVNHEVSVASPGEMKSADPPRRGLSVWLYLVEREPTLTNHPPERIGTDLVRPTPLPLNLHYLLTPVDDDPENEQLVLGKTMEVLNDRTTFPPQPGHPALTDVLRITLEPLDLESLTRIWNAVDAAYDLSVSYCVQAIRIDSGRQPLQVRPVVDRRMTVDQIERRFA